MKAGHCCILFLLLVVCSSATAHPQKRNGVNFLNGQWSAPKYDSATASESLHDAKHNAGVNWVALTYCHFQPSVDVPGPIYAKPSTPTKGQLKAVVSRATSQRIGVMFRPCIDPDWSNPNSTGTWRGMIGRYFNASQWDLWFERYIVYIVEQAKVAQELGVPVFSVGMEYKVASTQTNHWKEVVKKVREVYTCGKITYCANHGNEQNVEWWSEVDEISVDAYYQLATAKVDPTKDELVASWQPILSELHKLSSRHGNKSVVFAEIGYCSRTWANVKPQLCGVGANTPNMTAQKILYEAFYEAVYPQSWFAGVFWWAWQTDAQNRGVNNTGFTPNGKPAGAVMKRHGS